MYIYRLLHPITKEIKYIGKTSNVQLRLKRHIDQRNNGKGYSKSWIISLHNVGLKPIIEVIEECLPSIVNSREIYWISYYQSIGCNLCNLTKGGDGGSKTDQYAIKIIDKIYRCIELLNYNIPIKEAESLSGLSNGYISKARSGQIEFIVANKIIIPSFRIGKSHNTKGVLNIESGII